MNRHYKRMIEARSRRKVKKGRVIKLTKINLRVFEKQKTITELQDSYLHQRLALVKKGSEAANRITKILAKPHIESLKKIHEEIVKLTKEGKDGKKEK